MGGEPPFHNGAPIQAAYVTDDIERAVALFKQQFSINDFLRVGPVEVDLGADTIGELKVALAYRGGFQYELIEPVSGALAHYRNAVTPNAAATFHHLAYAMPSRRELTQARNALEEKYDICVHGEWAQDSAFFYADTRAQLGHYMEYFYAEPAYDALIPRN